tara:strand:- start:7564 stop:7863 length:300 start_codon:yes stop_codon:yes gene_type:complete
MGLINIIPQDSLPENPGVNQLVDSGTGALSVALGTITLGDVNSPTTITYTATTGDLPSDQEIFDLWAPVVGAANGAAGPAVVAPRIVASNDDVLYPSIS